MEWKITKLNGSMAKGKNSENTVNHKKNRRDFKQASQEPSEDRYSNYLKLVLSSIRVE